MRFVKKFTVNKPRNKLAQTCDPPRLYSQDKSFIQLVNKVKVNKALSCSVNTSIYQLSSK